MVHRHWLFVVLFSTAWAQDQPPFGKPLDQREFQPGYAFDYDVRDLAPANGPSTASKAREMTRLRGSLRTMASARSSAGMRHTVNANGLLNSLSMEQGTLSRASIADSETASRLVLRQYRQWLALSDRDVEGMRLRSRLDSDGIEVLAFEQNIGGVPVYEGIVKVGLNAGKEALHMSAGALLAEPGPVARASMSAEEAIRAGYRHLGITPPEKFEDITAVEVIFPMSPVEGVPAWKLFLETGSQEAYEMVIGGTDGRLLFRFNLYRNAGVARVWRESPMKGERELVRLPDSWVPTGLTITSNNTTDVYLDADGNNQPDGTPASDLRLRNGRAFSNTQEFDFPAGEATTGRNPREFQAASLINAFYFVNEAHDYFYELGFTEPAGNFQRDNFGRGGVAGDPVLVEVHDRGITNNANFLTLPDGRAARMQLGLFTRGTTTLLDDLDSAYDGTIVLHEYAHGVSNRLVGGGTQVSCLRGIQSGAMGEGWSDYFAMSFFENPVVGGYATQNRFIGIRRAGYENNRLSYESLGNNDYQVHRDGEIWAATLWDIRRNVGQTVADRLVLQGLKLTPCNPSMVDARDAILKADEALFAGANREALWRAFARRGFGSSASGLEGTLFRGTVYNAAYDLPANLTSGNRAPRVAIEAAPVVNYTDTLYYKINATDPDGDGLTFRLLDGPDGMTINPQSGELLWEADFVGKPVRVEVSDGKGGATVHAFSLLVNTPMEVGGTLKISGPEGANGRVLIHVNPGVEAMEVRMAEGTGDADLLLLDPSGVLYGSSLRLDTREHLFVSAPTPGIWQALVAGFRHYRDTAITIESYHSELLEHGSPVALLGSGALSHKFYRLHPHNDVYRLGVETYDGTGNVNVYVSRNAPPVCHTDPLILAPCVTEARSTSAGTRESITIDLPDETPYYATLVGVSTYSGVTLAGSLLEGRGLTVSPLALNFTAQVGRPAPPAQQLTLGGPEVPFAWTSTGSVTSTRDWLRLSRANGAGRGNVAISVDTRGLTAGTYSGTVTITAPKLNSSPRLVQVTLTMTP